MGFSLDRPLLAELLERYYGGISPTGQNDPPISASETRLLARMGVDLCRLCARMLTGGTPLQHIDDAVSTYEEIHWGYCVEFVFGHLAAGAEASVYLFLDTHAVDELTRHLSEPAPPPSAQPDEQRISQLPVRLNWRETAAGGRQSKDQNTSQRLVLSFDGVAKGCSMSPQRDVRQNPNALRPLALGLLVSPGINTCATKAITAWPWPSVVVK